MFNVLCWFVCQQDYIKTTDLIFIGSGIGQGRTHSFWSRLVTGQKLHDFFYFLLSVVALGHGKKCPTSLNPVNGNKCQKGIKHGKFNDEYRCFWIKQLWGLFDEELFIEEV